MPTIYLNSYDLYREILEYDTETGKSRIIDRESCEVPLMQGTFTRQEAEVMGLFASPEGPVFILGKRRILGRFGEIQAFVVPAGDRGWLRFVLQSNDSIEFVFDYTERLGIGTNPYDNEPEDVDLAAWIAAQVRREAFFKLFTRAWINKF